jgi:hypothetical protein
MKRLLFLAALLGLALQSCGLFTNPEDFGELRLNIHFDGNNAGTTAQKMNSPAALQQIDNVLVVIREYASNRTANQILGREVFRKAFRLDSTARLRTVIQVPLQQAEASYFDLQIDAFDGPARRYTGQQLLRFDQKHRSVTANIALRPVAFQLNLSPTFPEVTNNRLFLLRGDVQDAAVTALRIAANSVTINLPVRGLPHFENLVMLLSDTNLVRVSAFSSKDPRGEASGRVVYTGQPADVLVALVWDDAVDLDLWISNPLRRTFITPADSGDNINGVGLLRPDDKDGYGPEIYEWRANNRPVNGIFLVRVRRKSNVAVSGRVYVFLREKQILPFSFAFTPQDTALIMANIPPISWPP